MLINQIKKLIRLVETSEIDELEVSRWGNRIRIRKNPVPGSPPLQARGDERVNEEQPPRGDAERLDAGMSLDAASSQGQHVNSASNGTTVKAPMVGTFYRAASPEAPPFVEVGSKVTVGQTLCIIEAMKLMNELPSEINGVVGKILVENGEPVEYGQDLFLIGA